MTYRSQREILSVPQYDASPKIKEDIDVYALGPLLSIVELPAPVSPIQREACVRPKLETDHQHHDLVFPLTLTNVVRENDSSTGWAKLLFSTRNPHFLA